MKQHTPIFIRIDDQILKLHINIDKEQLQLIIKQMINNCSIITNVNNYKEITYNFKDYYLDPHYKNVKIRVEEYPYHDAGYGDDDHPGIRYVSYTYYDYPKLIDELISICHEDEETIKSFNIPFGDSKDKLLDLQEEENRIHEILNSIVSESEKWKELRAFTSDMAEYADPNKIKPTMRIKDYFGDIMSCFNLVKVEVSTKEDIKNFYQFYSFLEFSEEDFDEAIPSIDDKDPIIKEWIIKEIGNPKRSKNSILVLNHESN